MTERIKLKDWKGGLLAGGKKAKGKGLPIEPSERNIQASIEQLLAVRRIYCDRLNSGKVEVLRKRFAKAAGKWTHTGSDWIRLCRAGTPDLYAILPGGRVLFLERKTREGKLSPAQEELHAKLRAAGAIVIVPRSVDDVVAFLDHYDQKETE